jgi:methylphosphotriester-DNA--protein-cysteine methyltransferase
MTFDYLCQRSYNQGISESYFQIRKAQTLTAEQIAHAKGKNPQSMAHYQQRAREMSPKDWFNSLYYRIQKLRRRLIPTSQEKIEDQLKFAFHEGWKFHQASVQADPEVLAFVLQKSYME